MKIINKNKILVGDAISILKEIDDDSIDCVITSPPYWGLRNYGTNPIIWEDDLNEKACHHEFVSIFERRATAGDFPSNKSILNERYLINYDKTKRPDMRVESCIKCGAMKCELGQEPHPDIYIKHLMLIFNEIWRVLKGTGTVFVNIGDTYAGSGGAGGRWKEGKYKKANKWKQHKINITRKSLIGVPFRFALAMINAGWILRNDIIWEKPDCIPESVKDRFTINFEHVFFFTKNQKYYFKQILEPIKDKTAKRSYFGGVNKGLEGYNNSKYSNNSYDASKLTGKNKRAVWRIPTATCRDAHFAVFPEKLVKICMDAGCPTKGLVLDPFAGTGTTCLVAWKSGRDFVGIELNEEYAQIAQKRVFGKENLKLIRLIS
ncbi:MAG: DNA-methyltransferase [Promethearchaeota archaeon]